MSFFDILFFINVNDIIITINDTITPIAKFITWFGGVTGLIVIGIILTIVLRNKVIGFCIWINLGTIALINQILKRLVQRPRPNEFRIIEETGYSFPSGHSMASAAFYGFLIIDTFSLSILLAEDKRKISRG